MGETMGSTMRPDRAGKAIAKARLDKLANAAPVEILGMGYRQALRDVLETIEREKFISRCPCMCHNHPFCDADSLKAKIEEMLANG